MRRCGPLIALALACGKAPAPLVASVRDLGALTFPTAVRTRDGGYSAQWAGKSVWVFGDTILRTPGEDGPSGASWRSSTAGWTPDGLIFDGPRDSKGAPPELLPFTDSETKFNADHRGSPCAAGSDCGARFALWPGPLIPDPDRGRALLFFAKLVARPGAFNFTGIGASIATWEAPEKQPQRGAGLLFEDGKDPPIGAAALVDAGQLYAYACGCANLACPCSLARAALADALDRSRWTFWDGAAFQADAGRAARVFDGAPMMSIHFSARLGRWLAVYSTPVGNTIEARTALRPEGPWSDAQVVAQTPAPPENWNYAGLAHPELSTEPALLVSYYRPLGGFDGEMRLLELKLR